MSAAEGFEEFVAIVEGGSITAAARALGLPRPTLSRRLARLEERLGVRLLHRTTRRITLTRQGDALYGTARRLVQSAREAEALVRRLDGVPRGLLRISVPPALPEQVFAGWLADFMTKYPEVQLEVVASNEHVDLVADGFDLAMRRGPISDPSLISRTIAINTAIAVASPDYIAEHGMPKTASDLGQHTCIGGFRAGREPDLNWPLVGGGSVAISADLMTNNHSLRLASASLGIGIAIVVDRTAADALTSGELVQVLPGVVGQRETVSFVYPDREFLEPKVRAFIDFLVGRIEESRNAKS